MPTPPDLPAEQLGLVAPPRASDASPVERRRVADTVAAHLAKAERRGEDTIWRPNPREQGLIGLTDAIAWFGRQGWSVCLPLIDSRPYDLVVDDGTRLLRIQVKTTTHRNRGRFVVSICTNGGNQSFHTKKRFDPRTSDLLYVLTDDWDRYVIPTSVITSTSTLTLGARMAPYRLDTTRPAGLPLPA